MGSVVTLGPVNQRRSVGIAVAVALLLVVLVVGMAFANSVGASRVADNARALHWTNASLGTASAARSALVQASTFGELVESGIASKVDFDFAMSQVTESRAALTVLRDTGQEATSLPSLARYVASVDGVVEDLAADQMSSVHSLMMGAFETSYAELVDALQSEQAVIQAQIDANTKGAARTTDFVRFFVMFAIPASAVLVYRFLARRAVREHQIKVDLAIAAERAVGRAKDEFIAGLSHELRTPLTSIYGFAEVLTDAEADDLENVQELAQIIANESAEMTRMVDDLLAAARIESSGIEIENSPTRLTDVVEAAISPFARAGLAISVSGDDVKVVTDAARLRHILVNLLSNAVRHGGPKIGIEISRATDTVDIEVWDNGQGVPKAQMDRMFDRFVHEGSSPLLTGSLGLGLAVASRMAVLLGGNLSYQRYVDKSYFVVTIPLPELTEEQEVTTSVADVIRAMSA
jgi:signal transduction histidine kinase